MKIKIITVLAGLFLVLSAAADTQIGLTNIEPRMQPDPPPGGGPVPLDGGLIGLIVAGGAVGYKRYKKMNEDSPVE